MPAVIWDWSKGDTQLKGRVPWGSPSSLTYALKKDGRKELAFVSLRLDEGRIHLQGLYVYQKLLAYQELVTKRERESARGLGHALLCRALTHISHRWNLSPHTDVWLEASGGEVTDDEAAAHASKTPLRKILEGLIAHPKTLVTLMYVPQEERAFEALLRKRPSSELVEILARKVDKEGSPTYLREVVKEALGVRENKKLVAHYKQLGFEVKDESDGLGVVMDAPLGDLQKICRAALNPLLG